MARSTIDPLEYDRPAYHCLFDLMEEYREEHPEATDDECFEHVCFRNIEPKESRRDV